MTRVLFAIPAVTLLFTAAILSYSDKSGSNEISDRRDEQRLTIESVHCVETVNYGEDIIVLTIAAPGNDTIELRKSMERAMNRRNWNIGQTLYFHPDSAVTITMVALGARKKTDTLGTIRLGRIPAGKTCHADYDFKSDKFNYKFNYKLEGAETGSDSKDVSGSNDVCGRI
jgi:hypothetical protein